MSCYILNQRSINYLVDAAHALPSSSRPRVLEAPPSMLGQSLTDENVRSYNARYEQENATPEVFTWNPLGEGVSLSTMQGVAAHYGPDDLAQIFKMLDCYEYQACEDETWEASTAKKICDAIRLAYSRCVAGYDDAEWGFEDYTHEVETIER